MTGWSLWYHDGSGRAFPALETSRRVETVEVTVGDVVHAEERIYRGLVVFTAGELNDAGLDAGANAFLDVPEGLPTEKGTCSHTQFRPGTPEHRESVLNGLEGEEYVDRAIEHGYIAAEDRLAALAVRRDGLVVSGEGSPGVPS